MLTSIHKYKDGDEFTEALSKEALALAEVFLGKDPRYPGYSWNTPGQIDAYLARKTGHNYAKPEENVAWVLMNYIVELYKLEEKIEEEKLINEQWQPAATGITNHYVYLLMGIPEGGISEANAKG
jgi:hypothetical protein